MSDREQAARLNLVRHEADKSLWPVNIERANSRTPFDELAKLLGAVNVHTYQPFFPGENLENFVTREWLAKKAQTLEQRALREAEYRDSGIGASTELSKEANSDRRSGVWVAYLGKEIIGVASTEQLNSKEVMIANLHVAPAHQGKSIGTALLAEALEAAEEGDMLVRTHNETAGGFYRKFGFKPTGQTETALLFGTLPTLQTTFRLAQPAPLAS